MGKKENKKKHLPLYGIGPALCCSMALVTASLVEDYFVENFDDYKGRVLSFKITELDKEKVS